LGFDRLVLNQRLERSHEKSYLIKSISTIKHFNQKFKQIHTKIKTEKYLSDLNSLNEKWKNEIKSLKTYLKGLTSTQRILLQI